MASCFKKRYRAHLGTDFSAPGRKNNFAAADGKIEFLGIKGGYGKQLLSIIIMAIKTLYAHQSDFAKKC